MHLGVKLNVTCTAVSHIYHSPPPPPFCIGSGQRGAQVNLELLFNHASQRSLFFSFFFSRCHLPVEVLALGCLHHPRNPTALLVVQCCTQHSALSSTQHSRARSGRIASTSALSDRVNACLVIRGQSSPTCWGDWCADSVPLQSCLLQGT